MTKGTKDTKGRRKGLRNFIPAILILLVIAGIPLLILNIQSSRTGLTMGASLKRILNRTGESDVVSGLPENQNGESIPFLTPEPIGENAMEPPLISNLAVADLDKDGLLDVVVCDCRANAVTWIRQYPAGTYTESKLAENLVAPAHVEVVDFDGDGDNDIMVAVLGLLFPSNDKIGSVVVLENDGKNTFVKHVIEEKIARVSDVRAADLDGDGDKDLVAGQFGYDDGETRWIENLGNWKFRSHILQHLSGPINVIPEDIDADGDLDLVSLVSQEWEEIYVFINDGKGNFTPNLVFGSSNEDFGSSGIYLADVDLDGDKDILYTNGDAFDYIPPQGRPWHGIQWLENKGNLQFEFHRLATFIGAYNARPYDIDGDGDLDLFSVSAFNLWEKTDAQSFIWLENTGGMKYVKHDIASNPTHIITMEMGDFNADGKIDFVTGGMHAYPPYDRLGRVVLWTNTGKLVSKE
ncbi:MAG: VCBS repeat-containing protein [Bacteroidales bacterium]